MHRKNFTSATMTKIASQIPAYQGSCFEQRTSHIIAGFAPIESRGRDHDLNSADEQSEEADSRDPVRHADKRSMRGGPNFGARLRQARRKP